MEVSPQSIRSTAFKTARKGYDPDEVNAFKERVAAAVELAQNQATSMEARARAAVAKLQELSQQNEQTAARVQSPAEVIASTGDAETISRALLLAQRTADSTIANARAEADRILADARGEAATVVASANADAAAMIEDGRAEARRATEAERLAAEGEVQALLARRDFLIGDVDQLEQYLVVQRERLRDAAVSLQDLVERVPGGLGEMRRPLLSASAEPVAPAAVAPAAGSADETEADDSPAVDPDATQAMDRPDVDDTADRIAPSVAAQLGELLARPTEPLAAPAPVVDPDPTPPEGGGSEHSLASRLDANDVWKMVDEAPADSARLPFDDTGELPKLT